MRPLLALLLAALALLLAAPAVRAAPAEADKPCLECHKTMKALVVGKEAEPLACSRCHGELDGSVTPHRGGGRLERMLVVAPGDTCLQCHKKDDYANTRHGKLGAGCTGCHGAHAAKHGQLVAEDAASTCYTCHKVEQYKGKVTHKPVAQGDCGDCHAMHATEHPGLLSDPIVESCNACHGKVKKKPHAVSGFNNKGHPVGGEAKGIADPLIPGRPFYCGSCHDPHRSGERRLLRYGESTPAGFCQACHRK